MGGPDLRVARVQARSSNAIVLARNGQTIGIGAGQMSRVDAVRIAVKRRASTVTRRRVRCSRAMRSSRSRRPQIALDAGIAADRPAGGSKRDDEVVAAVEAAGAAMVFTGRRHFRH